MESREIEYGRCLRCRKIWSVEALKRNGKGTCACGAQDFSAVWPGRVHRLILRWLGR